MLLSTLRSPLILSLLYAVLGVLWILFSDQWLGYLAVDIERFAEVSRYKGVAFVLVSAGLIFLALTRYAADRSDLPSRSGHQHQVVLAFIVLLLVVPLLGVSVTRLHGPELQQRELEQLSHRADQKRDQIRQWLEQGSRELGALESLLETGAGHLAPESERFAQMQQAVSDLVLGLGFAGARISLPGQDAMQLGAAPEASTDSPALRPFRITQRDWLQLMQDQSGQLWVRLARPSHGDRIALELFAPFESALQPLLSDWLLSHDTLELQLLQARGDSAVYLSPLKFTDAAPATQALPLFNQDVVAVMAVASGNSGEAVGKDYRGVSVLSAYRQIPDTPWTLVVERDLEEVLAPLDTLLQWILLIGMLFMLVVGVVLLLFWRQQRLQLSLQARAELDARDRILQRFYELPLIGMGIYDPLAKRWVRVNDELVRLLGYPREQLMAMDWRELTPPKVLEEEEYLYQAVLEGIRDGYQMEKQLRHAAGHLVEIKLDVQMERESDGGWMLAMMQDISQQKHSEALIQRQANLYNMLSQTNQMIVRRHAPDRIFQSACDIAVRFGKLRFAWIAQVDDKGQLKPLASAGLGGESLPMLIQLCRNYPEQGLTMAAIRQGERMLANNVFADPRFQPWYQLARRHDIHAAIVLPITDDRGAMKVMTLYASEPDFFSDEVVDTLDELSHDISFALANYFRDQALESANQVINASPVVLMRWDNKEGWPVTYVSDNVRLWGIEPATLMAGEFNYEQLIHPDDRATIAAEVAGHLKRHENEYQQLYRLQLGNGDVIWVEDHTHVQRDLRGNILHIEGVLTDVTERQQQEARLERASAVLDSTREAVVVTDAQQRIIQINPAFGEMFGWSEQELNGKTPHQFASGQHDQAFYRHMWQSLDESGHWQGEIMSRRRNGEVFPALLSISVVRDPRAEISHYVGVYTDLSRLRESESRLEYQALHDPLTGLPNRQMLFTQLEHCIQYNRRHTRVSALLMIDLDNFKDVNDSFGHLMGDQLLQQAAKRLKLRLREEDMLFRLGGDEFAVLLDDVGSGGDAANVALSLIRQFDGSFTLSDGVEVRIGASIGISLVTQVRQKPEDLLQQADAALFRAKERRGSLSFYSDDLTQAARQRIELEQRLGRAIEANELRLYYQPQWSLESGEITGVEALVRWEDPERGLISPAEFISLAEQTVLIDHIGRWILNEACDQIARWQAAGLQIPRVAVNVSPQQLRYHSLPDEVAKALERTGIAPELLELELTEGALMAPNLEPVSMLGELRSLGVRLAIDDFGTGYSSLAYLKRFPLDLLKIDKSFTDDLLESDEARAIVETIIVLGHKLGLRVLAEGVELETQRALLEELGCHQYQGYLGSRPLPVAELESLLKQDGPDLQQT
ncbi:diguanylate cyclase (GGDEF)-like protein/PAS domain S-box-containing protein [Marinobacterium sp. MBR-111]|jgi:diguanylate cyclase (GGDEF)-like protein/PAS domain S-box-containing protein|uniref:EAL domain-containing protein n=1 Tax=Marinobacterium sp. MBR-111 TaxID=3156463 RepID=UPI00339459F1